MGIRAGAVGSIIAMYTVVVISDAAIEFLAIMATQAIVFAVLSLKELK